MNQMYAAAQSTLKRTFQLWLFSNLGGTLLLTALFAAERLSDYSIGLMAGTVAALVSLAVVPLVLPFFWIMEKQFSSWPRRTMALVGVSLFYVAANQLMLLWVPLNSLSELLTLSSPYLAAALLTVLGLYGPGLGQRHSAAAMAARLRSWLGPHPVTPRVYYPYRKPRQPQQALVHCR